MKKVYLILLLFVSLNYAFSQGIGINNTGSQPDSTAILDVNSTSQGMLIPRMTEAQKNAINSPAEGLMIYQTDTLKGFWYYDGISWAQLAAQSGGGGGTGSGAIDTMFYSTSSAGINADVSFLTITIPANTWVSMYGTFSSTVSCSNWSNNANIIFNVLSGSYNNLNDPFGILSMYVDINGCSSSTRSRTTTGMAFFKTGSAGATIEFVHHTQDGTQGSSGGWVFYY